MNVPRRRRAVRRTVLVVNSDAAVLALLAGILQNDYRVLLAADAESAVRLLTIDRLRIDLAIVDRKVRGSRGSRWQERMTEILPQLRILSIAGIVQDEIIRLKVVGSAKERISDSFIQQVRTAFSANQSGHEVPLKKERNKGRASGATGMQACG